MASSTEANPEFSRPLVGTWFFPGIVKELLEENLDFTLSASLGPRRNVQVLHLIDHDAQAGMGIGYHIVYEAFNSEEQTSTHGMYVANLWPRQPKSQFEQEGRHYFEAGEGLIAREDSHHGSEPWEFIKDTAPEDQDALDIAVDFLTDISRVVTSQPIKPASLVFNQFPRSR